MLRNILMLLVYIILITYALIRITGWIKNSFSFDKKKRKIVNICIIVIFILASSTIMIWMPFSKFSFSTLIIKTSNYWLGFFIEFITMLILSDIILLIIKLIRKKKGLEPLSLIFHRIYGVVVFFITFTITIAGFVNARHIYTTNYDITVDKKNSSVNDLNVVLIADTHMGYNVGCPQIRDMVEKINQTNPDVVIIAGDLFDNNYDSLDNPDELASLYRQIKSTYGVYATFGNHDVSAKLVGGFTVSGSRLRDSRMEQFLKDSNIKMMLDDTVTIANDSIYLIGRIDEEEPGDNSQTRKSLEELTKNLDSSKPLFVINHEPTNLQNYADNNVDVLFSGHTHDGQTFPLNLSMPFAWKNAHGCIKVDNMYSLVTSGIGVYGPYMRIFTKAEIMNIHIHFN